MAHKITVTGKIGPGNTITSLVFNDVKSFFLDLIRGQAQIEQINNQITNIDIDGTTTLTDTIAAKQHTIVVSQ